MKLKLTEPPHREEAVIVEVSVKQNPAPTNCTPKAAPDGVASCGPSADKSGGTETPRRECTLLLVSHDLVFGQNLRSVAELNGRRIVRVEEAGETFRTLRATRPEAILVDLDLPADAGWSTAERLLEENNCPPVLLFTGRTTRFDLGIAIRAGSIIDKSTDPNRLLEMVERVVSAPRPAQAERSAIQRVVVLRLKPVNWPARETQSYRHWGINE
jgi:CheY-like chemotaxis protein